MSTDSIPWNDLFSEGTKNNTGNIAAIMKDYCERIKWASSLRVEASYYELKREERPTSISPSIVTMFSRDARVSESALSDRKDINELYEPHTFVFDIHNKMYQFRLCELSYGPEYPIDITIDEDVEDEVAVVLKATFELTDNGSYLLASDDELKDCFRILITSKRTRSILSQLYRG